MTPLSDQQRREHMQAARLLEFYETSWKAVCRGDMGEAMDLLERAQETLKELKELKEKVTPIRGPKKGGGS